MRSGGKDTLAQIVTREHVLRGGRVFADMVKPGQGLETVGREA
jgi:hypothetical protein